MIRIREIGNGLVIDDIRFHQPFFGTDGHRCFGILLHSGKFLVIKSLAKGKQRLDSDSEFKLLYSIEGVKGFEIVTWEFQPYILIKAIPNSILLKVGLEEVEQVWSKNLFVYKQQDSSTILGLEKIGEKRYKVSVFSIKQSEWTSFDEGRSAFICANSLIVEHSNFEFTVYKLNLDGSYTKITYTIPSKGLIRSIQTQWAFLLLREEGDKKTAELRVPFKPVIYFKGIVWVSDDHKYTERYIRVRKLGDEHSYWIDAMTGVLLDTLPKH